MKHLHSIHDKDFCEWITFYNSTEQLELSWKLDGFFLRFGKDSQGKFWFQTSRSPVMNDPMDVIWYALSKGYDNLRMSRAENYFHLLKKIEESELLKLLPFDSGLECEIFDKAGSFLEETTGLRRFVNIPYDAEFFKTDITIFVYRMVTAQTGDVWVDGFPHNAGLGRGIFGTRFELDVDFSYFQNVVHTFSPSEIKSLSSLRHADRHLKVTTKEKVGIL